MRYLIFAFMSKSFSDLVDFMLVNSFLACSFQIKSNRDVTSTSLPHKIANNQHSLLRFINLSCEQ